MKRLIVGAVVCTSLAACQGAGPRTDDILRSNNAIKLESSRDEAFVLVEVNREVAEKVAAATVAKTTARFVSKGQAGPVVIGSGDLLDIAIVSTNQNGFIDFSQSSISPVSTTNLPPQSVGSDGNVNVPPLGRVRAAGQTVQQFETFLIRRLGEVLVDPSVIVNLSDRRSARVSVLGDVNTPGAYSINQESKHLIDVITLAGGPASRPEDLTVTMSRGGRSGTVNMAQLLANPQYNAHLRPGDVINVEAKRNRYTILGAATQNATTAFAEPNFSVADALGAAGGLLNRRADKEGVFLYREASKQLIEDLGVNTMALQTETAPTIFQFDLSEPTTLFAMGKFQIEEGDILYISDSQTEEVNAAVGALTTFVPAPVEYVRDATIGN